MWKILKAEFNYNRSLLLGLAVIIFFVYVDETLIPSNKLTFMSMVLTFALINYMIISENKEKRNRHYIILPFSIKQIVIIRILKIIIPCFSICFLYFIIRFIYKPAWSVDSREIIVFFGFIPFGYSVYFILSDLLKFKLEKTVKMALIFVLFLLTLVLFVLTITVISNGVFPVVMVIVSVFDFIFGFNSFFGGYGSVIFLSCTFILLCLSFVTFVHRKSYL